MRSWLIMWLGFIALNVVLLAIGIDQPMWWWIVLGLAVGSIWGWFSWRRS